jgi:steroid delta-isomerase-like uncharacterized protein
MASKNVETVMRAHQAFNDRKLEECAGYFSDGGIYRDIPRGKDFTGGDEIMDFLQGWATAFSDGTVSDAHYTDGGDIVVSEFKARGTNDGNLGTFPASNEKIDLPYCEITRFDADGKIAQVTAYYDFFTLLMQLGHLQVVPEAEARPTT